MTDGRQSRGPTRSGSPPDREPARFITPDRPNTYDGHVIGATCESCMKVDRSKGPLGRKQWRCGIAVSVAREDGRRLPDTISPTRPACSRYKPNRRRK